VPGLQPPPTRRRGLRTGLIIGGVVLLAIVVAIVVRVVVTPGAKGSLSFPGTLLGLNKNTSPAALAIDRQLSHGIAAGGKSKVLHVKAAIYGDPTGAAFAVAGGGICSTCAPKSVGDAEKAIGFPGIQSFPPGPNGGVLLCAPHVVQGRNWFYCWWFDQKTGGYVAYGGGTASGLSDAAGKTNQIRAAVEH
jgi:hypothetical protein